MLTVKRCGAYLKNKNLNDKEIEDVRNYLYLISKEIIQKNIGSYIKKINFKDKKSESKKDKFIKRGRPL
jgi:hypothetical protein